MQGIHDNLTEKSSWYKRWHEHDHHHIAHWVIFILLVLACGLLLSNQISNWVYGPQEGDLYVTLPKRTAVMSLEPKTSTVKVGETFAADIILDTGDGPIDGVDIYALHYDPSILEVVDDVPNQKGKQIKPGTIIGYNAANIVEEDTGSIKFGQASAGGTTFTGRGVLATIHFKAKSTGTSYLKFDFERGKTTDTNAAHKGKDQLTTVVDAIYTVVPK